MKKVLLSVIAIVAIVLTFAATFTAIRNLGGDDLSVKAKNIAPDATHKRVTGLTGTSDLAITGSAILAPVPWYVNDGSPAGDHYTTAAGNDANPGTPAAPFATIQHAIDLANEGDTIWVDAGTYVEDITNPQKNGLVFIGSNFGINPSTGVRVAESVLLPATSDPDVFSPGSRAIFYLDSTRHNVIDGFTFDGDNPALTSAVNINGANIDAIEAVGSWNAADSTTITNNIIQNFTYAGVELDNYMNGAMATSGNLVSDNKMDNLIPSVYGIGVLVSENCYTTVSNNVMTRMAIGIQINTFAQPDPGNSHYIQDNTIESGRNGIWHNLAFGTASTFIITGNQVSTVAGSVNNNGIKVTSMQASSASNINANSVTGARTGYYLWNNFTSNTITPTGGTLTNCSIGVYASNYDPTSGSGGSSAYLIDGIVMTGCDTAVWVRDQVLNTNGATTSVTAGNNNAWDGAGGTGILLEGGGASFSFTGATPVNFTNLAGWSQYIRYISNGADVPTGGIDATLAAFNGQTGAAMTDAQLFSIEDKVDHKIDYDSLGFVTVKANNDYVTPNSFYLPNTTTAKIQRGVTAASNGWTENVAAGTYVENVTVDKSLTILGAAQNQNANTRFGAFIGLKADPTIESIVTAPVNDPSGPNPLANDLFRVIADDITINGFVFDGNNPSLGVSTVQDDLGLDIHARRAITNIDTANGFNPVNNLDIRYNIMQNLSTRAVSLSNNGPVSTGNLITENLVRNYGWDPAAGSGIILFTNAYADIINNTIDAPVNQIGLHLQNFFSNGSMTWSGNSVTVGQNGIGIHTNQFTAASGSLNITGNTVNAATGVAPTSLDYTWGINIWLTGAGSAITILNNTVGAAGGTFDRGINLWNNTASIPVTVRAGSVGKSAVGIVMDNVEPDFGAATGTSNSVIKSVAITTAATQTGIRVRSNTVNAFTPLGNVSAIIDSVNITGAGINGILIDAPIAPFTASAEISNSSIDGSLTGISLTGSQSTANIHDNPSTIQNAVVGLNISAGNVTNLFRNRFTNNATGISIVNGGILGTTQENFVNNSATDAFRAQASAGAVGPIINNDLSANGGYSINNLSLNPIVGTCNWHGSSSAAVIISKHNGLVVFTPALLNGTDNQPGTNGFQPIPGVCSAPLPVTFTSLNAAKVNCEVKVKWTIENQVNVDRYEVEVSKDGTNFTKVATIAAANVTAYTGYFMLNDQVKAPVIFIRVKNVDKDGNFKYSATITSAGTCESRIAWTVYGYPNPVVTGDMITLSTKEGLFNGRYKLTLVDNSGKVYGSQFVQLSNTKTYQFKFGQQLAGGKYMIVVKKDDGTEAGVVEFQKTN